MTLIRKHYTNLEKLKIAVEALSGLATHNEITQKYGTHGTQIHQWKTLLKEGADLIYERTNKKSQRERDQEGLVDELYRKIGQLEIERDWLKKKSERFC